MKTKERTNNRETIIKISMTHYKLQTLIGLLAMLISDIDSSEMTRESARELLDDILTKNKRYYQREENLPSHIIK